MTSLPLSSALVLLLMTPAGPSDECPSPPVTTAAHDVCIARYDLEREWSVVDWKGLEPRATKKDDGTWLIQFINARPGVRGGGGEVTLDSVSGKVTRRLGYK